LAEKYGDYLVAASTTAGSGVTGTYVIAREGARSATERDKRRIEVDHLFKQALAALLFGHAETLFNRTQRSKETAHQRRRFEAQFFLIS
jgi:hypothetical protein